MEKSRCFVDTSALIALNNVNDQYHTKARDIASKLTNIEFIISDAIINETYNILRYRIGYHRASFFLKTVLAGPPFIIADIDVLIRKTASQILEQYSDQKISYCDAISVSLMKEQKIQKIFAFDHHFEVMGVELYL
ncbi:type II toxin-antitoxin system VapC family toxin [Paucisalibacillus globulus]|uniref:type II toxin-antitoxin system VapC family toxin n=1 Tax=Paucisalibacillus globulus TaxID=351095 RepID=UPI00047AF713|nr:PIN domain-containing protein [Paucisalibacillus globulus]